jgi:hypothetical protein
MCGADAQRVEDVLRVFPADLCAVVVAQQRIVEPFDGIGHALVGVVDREQQPVAADFTDRVEQRPGVEVAAAAAQRRDTLLWCRGTAMGSG